MKAKTKLIATLMAMCLVITLGVFGILAVKTLNMSVGGNITFSAEGIAMKLSNGEFKTTGGSEYTGITAQSGKLQGFEMNTNTKLSDVQDKINSWTGLELVATESLGDAVLHFTITNLMQNETLAVVTTTSLGTNLNENMNIVVSPSTANIAYGTPQSFTIKFEVLDKSINAKLTGFTVAMQMYAGTVSEGTTDTNLVYTESASVANTYTVKAATTATGEVKIPQFVKQETGVYPVTEIEAEAFKENTAITSITIPESVTSIGTKAFYGCTALTTIVNNSQITSIPSYAFYKTAITELPSLANVQSIGSYAFCFCKSLTTIEIPDNVTTIGSQAFYGCSKVTELKIGSGLTSLPYMAFGNCSTLNKIDLPDTITSYSTGTFLSCSKLTSFEFGPQITTVPSRLFEGCTSLSAIHITDKITSINSADAFDKCPLSTITVDSNNTIYTDGGDNAIIEKSTNTLVVGSNTTKILSTIKKIGTNAFRGRTGVGDIVVPEGVTSIGSYAFHGCDIKSVVLPDSLTKIESSVFYSATSLASVTFGKYVTTIGSWAFRFTKLTTVHLPSTVTSLGSNSFVARNSTISIVYMDCNVPSGAAGSILFNYTEYVYIKENIVVTDSAFTEVESDVAGYKKYTETLKGTTSSNY